MPINIALSLSLSLPHVGEERRKPQHISGIHLRSCSLGVVEILLIHFSGLGLL